MENPTSQSQPPNPPPPNQPPSDFSRFNTLHQKSLIDLVTKIHTACAATTAATRKTLDETPSLFESSSLVLQAALECHNSALQAALEAASATYTAKSGIGVGEAYLRDAVATHMGLVQTHVSTAHVDEAEVEYLCYVVKHAAESALKMYFMDVTKRAAEPGLRIYFMDGTKDAPKPGLLMWPIVVIHKAIEHAEYDTEATESAALRTHFLEAAEHIMHIAMSTDSVYLPNVWRSDYSQQVETLVEDVKYIFDHIKSLESSANSDRAYEFLIDLTDAAVNRSAQDFMPDSENLKNLLQMVAKLKLWVPPEKDSGGRETAGATKKKKKKKKKGSPFVGRKDTENVAAGIVKELFDLKCRQWGMSGLLSAYESLPDNHKLCLLCFSAFPCEVDKESDPEHAVEKSLEIKNRILIHLWVGERFIDSNHEKTIEEMGEEILRVLTEKGFIEPVVKKGPKTKNGLTGSSRMHPFVHSFVMALAKRAGFFEFSDEGGKVTAELGSSQRACLLKSQGKLPSSCQLWGKWANDTDSRAKMMRFQTIQTLFNVDESIIDVKTEWFSKMKHMNVLHLGSWSARTTEHIEVEDQKFLEEVKIMKQMRLLSLQGVSTILKLPDSVTELENLVILDLRECQSLEELPDKIGLLKNLTHLDVTNCHLLTKLPKGVSKLSKLEVLKGFVISEAKGAKVCNSKEVFGYVFCAKKDDACTLEDLKEVKRLRDLSIVVNREHFPNKDEVQVFTEMYSLRMLRISWEGGIKKEQGNNNEEQEPSVTRGCLSIPRRHKPAAQQGQEVQSRELSVNSASLEHIEKLELLCMPNKEAPDWLDPDRLKGLKRLYIKGGALKSLPGSATKAWNVETLRLKYMPELEIRWVDLKKMFPEMKYLENYECNKLEHFPCDQKGIWKEENELH